MLDQINMDGESIPKFDGWRAGFWLMLFASVCWLAASLYVWPMVLSSGLGLFRGRSIELTAMLLTALLLVQPIIIAWLIFRAIVHRTHLRRWRLIRSAVLPLSTLLILAGVSAVPMLQRHLREQRYRELYRPGNIITTNYICERNHASVDFHRNLLKRVDLRLTSIVKIGTSRSWIVREIGRLPYPATTFSYDTESIGGSEGIRWRSADGQLHTGAISFSDLHGEMGSGTLWVYIPIQKRLEIDEGWHPTFTCGPVRQSIAERKDR